jgi:ABC-type polysaccharide/polyol phosphate transport system ATPase subunit/MoaA/NifB/PqqE/SkfB family radical SAM enzyme
MQPTTNSIYAINDSHPESDSRIPSPDSLTSNSESRVPDPEIAISVRNLTKIYKLYNSPQDRLKEALNPFRRKFHKDFYALNDVSFEIKKGETVGIIGQNGSGKSTLLKIITGVLTPSNGAVSVNGSISALLELGAGFNPDLTGIENIYFHGTLMGFTNEQITARIDDILAFADIGDYVNQPVKTYSSGMFVRLAFSVAVIAKPDILIVDEALSVGDIFFQQKCYAKMREILSAGTTCLFVSHDTKAFTNICNHAILLRNGAIDFQGTPEETVSRYYATMGKRAPTQIPTALQAESTETIDVMVMAPAEIREHSILYSGIQRHGAGGIIVAAARVTDGTGLDTLKVPMMETLHFHILLRANENIHDPSTGIHLYDRLGNLVFAAGTRQLKQRLPELQLGQELVVRMDVTFSVQPGEYTFSLGAAEPNEEGDNLGYVHDRIENLGPILVTADPNEVLPFYGIARLPLNISFNHGASHNGSVEANNILVNGNEKARITWMISNWCNYKCDYCGVPFFSKKESGITYDHAFDHYPVDSWVGMFKIFPQQELYLKITGGEPFIDRKNIITLLNGLSEFSNIKQIRIDTNGSWEPNSFLKLNKEKIALYMCYHPTQISYDKFIENALRIRDAGFAIPVINFVLSPENYPSFEEVNRLFEHHGFLVNASIMIPAGQYSDRSVREEAEAKIIEKYAAPIDIKYKMIPYPTKGRPCLHPVFSYLLNFNGQITVDCLNEWQNVFEKGLPLLPENSVRCPKDYCFGCLEMYRELLDEPLANPGKGLYYLTEFAADIKQHRTSSDLKKQ